MTTIGSSHPDRTLSLAGDWAFSLDPNGVGLTEAWFSKDAVLGDTIHLPSTTDEQKKGPENKDGDKGHLTRLHPYVGAAWYRRDFEVPVSWAGKRITLYLERTKITTLWLDGVEIGSQESLATAHIYDLGAALRPGGTYQLTLRVDNAALPPIGNPHQISADTQTNWNGVVGEIALFATDSVWIDNVQLTPDVSTRSVRITLDFASLAEEEVCGCLSLAAKSWNGELPAHQPEPMQIDIELDGSNSFEFIYSLGEDARFWSEFSPELYRLKFNFTSKTGEQDSLEMDFGLREFRTQGTQFTINEQVTFLRGKHDACVFPLTGYAPMEVDEWLRILGILRDYGLNHFRCHTWCPPRAAFIAADRLGIYLQPELPFWGNIGESDRDNASDDVELHRIQVGEWEEKRKQDFILSEGKRILREFGNHPSFVMFALGNELHGSRKAMQKIVHQLREADGSRRLYAQGSNNFYHAPQLGEGDDYWPTAMTSGRYSGGEPQEGYNDGAYGKEARGAFHVHSFGHINNSPRGPGHDYRVSISDIAKPVIGHEVGQFQSYPDFCEINKYTGVLRARNLERFRERLAATGMLAQASDFARASGALSVLCYREEIEAALRTPGFGGFQLLDLQDFPGQGTALVGILDAFMDSKGFVSPEKWREFCAPVVPLLRYGSYTWKNSEAFEAQVELANYGPSALNHIELCWVLSNESGSVLRNGKFHCAEVFQGDLTKMGSISFQMEDIAAPQKLELTIEVRKSTANSGKAYRIARNSYPLWIYPDELPLTPPLGVTVARSYAEASKALAAGGTVLLLPVLDSLSSECCVHGAFQSDFWSYAMFKGNNKPGTLGILCDPEHPALAAFPSESHSNWQWWKILKNARPMILNNLPHAFRPIVQVIDNIDRNYRLGLVWEAVVGDAGGRLLVCTSDLLGWQAYAEVRQLLHSLYNYIGSDSFAPEVEVSAQELDRLFRV